MNAYEIIASTAKELFREVMGTSRPTRICLPPSVSKSSTVAVDILVIDVSISMDLDDYPPSRLVAAKRAATRFLETTAENSPEALAGIVAFAGEATLVSVPTPAKQNLENLRHRLDSLSTANATNISAGLALAQRELQKFGRPPKRIVLLTDGDSNTGADPVATASGIKSSGIQLDIIGIGGSPREVNEKDLRRMASVVRGELRYWFVESVGELARKFEALALREIK